MKTFFVFNLIAVFAVIFVSCATAPPTQTQQPQVRFFNADLVSHIEYLDNANVRMIRTTPMRLQTNVGIAGHNNVMNRMITRETLNLGGNAAVILHRHYHRTHRYQRQVRHTRHHGQQVTYQRIYTTTFIVYFHPIELR